MHKGTIFKGKTLFDDAIDLLDFLIDNSMKPVVHSSGRVVNSYVGNPGEIEFELPGVKKSDIKVKTQNSGPFTVVRVEAKRKDKTIYGMHAVRTDDIDVKGITSKYEDGLLTVHIPKSTKATEREIEIE